MYILYMAVENKENEGPLHSQCDVSMKSIWFFRYRPPIIHTYIIHDLYHGVSGRAHFQIPPRLRSDGSQRTMLWRVANRLVRQRQSMLCRQSEIRRLYSRSGRWWRLPSHTHLMGRCSVVVVDSRWFIALFCTPIRLAKSTTIQDESMVIREWSPNWSGTLSTTIL